MGIVLLALAAWFTVVLIAGAITDRIERRREWAEMRAWERFGRAFK